MDVDVSSGNDTEDDAPYLRDPRDTEDTETPLKTCGYAPYIMRVILMVTRRNFGMDVKHEPLRIKHPKHVRVPSDGRYDEIQ